MLRAGVTIVLVMYFVLLVTPAQAFSCDKIRQYVQSVGLQAAITAALAAGYSRAQINAIRQACTREARR